MFSFRCSNVARKFYICKYFLHLFSKIGENCENCVIGIAVGGGGVLHLGHLFILNLKNYYETHDY